MSTDNLSSSSSSSVFVSSQDASDTLGTSTSNTVSISSPLVRTLILPGRNSSLSSPPEVVNNISESLLERRSPLAISLEHHHLPGLLHHDLSSAFFQLKSPGNEAYPICSVTDFVSLLISRITFDLFKFLDNGTCHVEGDSLRDSKVNFLGAIMWKLNVDWMRFSPYFFCIQLMVCRVSQHVVDLHREENTETLLIDRRHCAKEYNHTSVSFLLQL